MGKKIKCGRRELEGEGKREEAKGKERGTKSKGREGEGKVKARGKRRKRKGKREVNERISRKSKLECGEGNHVNGNFMHP